MAKLIPTASLSSQPEAPTYPPFPDDNEVRKAAVYLGEALEVFRDGWNVSGRNTQIHYDPIVVVSLARSVLDDIWRYEVYHIGTDHSTQANSIKRAAYFTKWICRWRPIFVPRPRQLKAFKTAYNPETDISLFVNEEFAVNISLQTMANEFGKRDIVLSPAFFDRFIYDLHYRHFHEDALLEIYEMVRDRLLRRDIITR